MHSQQAQNKRRAWLRTFQHKNFFNHGVGNEMFLWSTHSGFVFDMFLLDSGIV